jgi:hypothetical protein
MGVEQTEVKKKKLEQDGMRCVFDPERICPVIPTLIELTKPPARVTTKFDHEMDELNSITSNVQRNMMPMIIPSTLAYFCVACRVGDKLDIIAQCIWDNPKVGLKVNYKDGVKIK